MTRVQSVWKKFGRPIAAIRDLALLNLVEKNKFLAITGQ